MIAICTMCVIVNTAKTIIEKVCTNDQQHSRNKKPKLVLMPDLFAKQQDNTPGKRNKWQQAVMMFFPAMIEGIRANTKGKKYHKKFKGKVVDNIYPKQGQ